MSTVFRYVFSDTVPLGEIEAILVRSLVTAEYLHGPATVRLDAGHYLDHSVRTCVIDAATTVGTDINKLFVGSLETAFGPDAFRVERLSSRAGVSSP